MSKLRRLLILSILAIILIVACDWAQPTLRDRAPNSLNSDRATPASAESCRLVSHEMGETEVCGQPQKVAALSPHILDSILALGVQPAAYAESIDLKIQTYDHPAEQIPYLGKWVRTKPMAVGDRYSPSLESLTLVQPDLILGEKLYNQDEYPLLTQIAPTLLFSDDKNPNEIQSWKQNIEGIAKALGRESQIEELFTAYDQQLAQARTALQPVLQAYPRVCLISSDLALAYSQPESTTGKLLKEIGFEIVQPPGIREDIIGDPEISWEILPQTETDIIIVLSWNEEPVDKLEDRVDKLEEIMQKKWSQKPLLKSMPVFQQGRVFFVDSYLWSGHTRGPLTDKLILEALPDLLLSSVKEADGAEEAR